MIYIVTEEFETSNGPYQNVLSALTDMNEATEYAHEHYNHQSKFAPLEVIIYQVDKPGLQAKRVYVIREVK